MELTGHVENGVVVLDEGATLPEGTRVTVSAKSPSKPVEREKRRIDLPLVRGTGEPFVLTNEMIADIFAEEDAEYMKGMWNDAHS